MNASKRAIRIEELSKQFELYARGSDMLLEKIFRKPRHQVHWALQDFNLEVFQGEIVGIIGRNGAGKSTLLKILTGTLEKTSGMVEMVGRVSSILELGTGFHAEYSGRENIFMSGLCLGLSKREINEKLDWIIDFSGLRSVIDQPLKTYSTGMQARLMFSTAASGDPDILIVDEVLSVGDLSFQRKCYQKIEEFRQSGKTILFVSHDIQAITGLCDRLVLLDEGKSIANGETGAVLKVYYQMLFDQEKQPFPSTLLETSLPGATASETFPVQFRGVALDAGLGEVRVGNRKAEITDVGFLNEQGVRIQCLQTGMSCKLQFHVLINHLIDDIFFGFRITTVHGVEVYGANTKMECSQDSPPPVGRVCEAIFTLTPWLAPGHFFLTVGVGRSSTEMYDRRADVLSFEVRGEFSGYTSSIANLNAIPSLRVLPVDSASVP